MPKVSVLIPCFNAESFLKEALEGALAQSFKDLELIIIDNNCTDKTIEIAESFQDPRIKIIKETKQGLATARNAGLKVAEGDYIALLDADDIWYPEKLEKEIAFLETHPEYLASYSAVDYIDKDGKLLNKSFEKLFGYSGEIFLNLLKANFIQIPSPIFRTESVTKLQGFDESLSFAEDWDFYLRLAYKGSVYFHPEAHCAYRKHGQQMTENYDLENREKDALYIIEKNFQSLSCHLKKLKSQASQLSEKKYKNSNKTPIKRRLALFFKDLFIRTRKKELKEPKLVKNRALSNLYFRLAKEHRENGDKTESKRCIKEALRLDSRRYLEPISIKLLLF